MTLLPRAARPAPLRASRRTGARKKVYASRSVAQRACHAPRARGERGRPAPRPVLPSFSGGSAQATGSEAAPATCKIRRDAAAAATPPAPADAMRASSLAQYMAEEARERQPAQLQREKGEARMDNRRVLPMQIRYEDTMRQHARRAPSAAPYVPFPAQFLRQRRVRRQAA